MAVSTTQEFFDLLAKSEVLTAARLADARREAESAPDPKGAARELVRLSLLTAWQASTILKGSSTLKLGKYSLLDRLGSEEIGQVYLAEHVQMGRRVVIKTLSNKHTNNAEAVKRFLNEAQRIAALHHRNIIHLFDVSSEQDRYYIVLEHVEGKDFQSLVTSGGALDRDLAADYLIQAAEGLAHAHGKSLYHGDIKAENLLVDSQGQVKILNFGVARLIEESAQPADAATDLRALGEVGTYLLTGKTGLGDRKSAPPGLETLCLKMTTKNDAERFASADEAAAVLKKWLAEQKAAGPSAAPKIARTAAVPAVKPEPPKQNPKPPALVKRGAKLTETGATAAVASSVAVAEAETETDPFKINIDVRGKSKAVPEKPKAAPAPSPELEDESAEATTEPAVEKKLPLPLLIGGGAGAGVLAMLLLALGVWFFWPKGEKEVVQADEPLETTHVDPDESLKNPEIKVDEPAPVPEKPVEPEKKPEPMPEPPKVEPAKPDPPPVEPVKPEPPKEPVPSPIPAPGPQKNPFTDLGLAVDLPKLGTAEAPEADATNVATLGSLYVQPKDLFFVDLAGGDKAANKGKQSYSIKAAKGGTADREWEISMGEGGAASVIATLSAKDDKLNFQWTDKAVADPVGANQLRNCVLTSRTGAFAHALAFRKPVEAQPITVAFEKKEMKSDVTIDFLPDVGSIEIEVTSLEGAFPTHKFDPKASFEAAGTGKNKDSVAILLGKEKEETLILKVESQLQRKLTVSITPFFRLKMQPKEIKYNAAMWKQATSFVTSENFKSIAAMDAANKKQPADENFKSQAKLYNDRCQEAIKQVDEMNATHAALNNTGKIHFRVYYKAGEQTVDLARTAAAPAAAPPAAK